MPPRGRPSAASPGPRGRAGASPSPAPAKAVAKTAKKGTSFFSRHGNVYVYVPNLIGARARDHRYALRQLGAALRRDCRGGAPSRRALATPINPNAS